MDQIISSNEELNLYNKGQFCEYFVEIGKMEESVSNTRVLVLQSGEKNV